MLFLNKRIIFFYAYHVEVYPVFKHNLRGSKTQLKINISCHKITDEKFTNLFITNNNNKMTKNQEIVALHYVIIYHFTKFQIIKTISRRENLETYKKKSRSFRPP